MGALMVAYSFKQRFVAPIQVGLRCYMRRFRHHSCPNRKRRPSGFHDWQAFREFWREEHPGIDDFVGVIIFWEPL